MPSLPPTLQANAQIRWQNLIDSLASIGVSVDTDQTALQLIRKTLIFSDFVHRQFLHRPQICRDLVESQDLVRSCNSQNYQDRLAEASHNHLGHSLFQWPMDPDTGSVNKTAVMKALRHFRHREMVRIAIRDIGGLADLEETMADLSALADTCISATLSFLYATAAALWGTPMDRQGQAMQMVVLGLGKLGAGELNFSSDVDLMFAFPEKGETQGGPKGRIANEEFFTRLCRDLIQLLGHTTEEGFVFRVDTRLRPYGESGPLTMHFDRLEDYYQEQGREWERYALIKARVVSGDYRSGRELLHRLKPFIFRRYLDYGAFDNLREMKGRIDLEIKGKGLQDNIKLGPGGIREIEFFGQIFQLLRGGVDPALQIRPIRKVLRVLVQRGNIQPEVQKALDEAYVFLRTVENRIQQWADQQEHRLPTDPDLQIRMAVSLGFDDWDQMLGHLDKIRRRVHRQFNELLAPAQEKDEPASDEDLSRHIAGIWQNIFDGESARQTLSRLGYRDPQKVLLQIAALREDRSVQALGRAGHERLNRLLPMVLQAVVQAQHTEAVLEHIFNLIRCIHRRTAYLALMLENPSILHHLVTLTGASPWIAEYLCRHPVLLDELVDPRTLYRPPRREELEDELNRRLATGGTEDLEYWMESLRVFKQVNLLRVAASDITSVLPLMKVSDHLSDIAEVTLNAAATLCWEHLKLKYGTPICRLDNQPCEKGFSIIAYGKLGGLELGYGSDLDLVFLHAAESGQSMGGNRSIDNTTFFTRLGQRVLHMLTTHTGAGTLYPVDMRLRPSGDSGMLVSHMDGFAAYQHENAWTWEHQALLRARAVYGDPQLKQRFEQIRQEILTLKRDDDHLKQQVADMRDRLRKKNQRVLNNQFDIKQDAGGILDIEFIVQYLSLKYAHQYPQIVRWTDNVRQLQALNEVGILNHTTAFALRRAYLIYRAMAHRLNLKRLDAVVANDRFLAPRQFVRGVWKRLFE